jgi:hypothetical protein
MGNNLLDITLPSLPSLLCGGSLKKSASALAKKSPLWAMGCSVL